MTRRFTLIFLLLFLFIAVDLTAAAEEANGREMTFSDRIDELEAQQRSMQQASKGVDERLSSFERKLEALEARSKQQDTTALTGRVTELEQKLQLLEARFESSITASNSDSKITAKFAKVVPSNRLLEAELQTPEAEPIAINLAEVTDIEGDESAIGFEITADYYGKYIWRGQNLTDDPVFQPGISMTMGGFTGGIWGSLDTTNKNGQSGEFTEYDYSLDYSGDVPFLDKVGYSVGVINYYFPSAEDTTEVYWGFALDIPLSPSITFYHDVDDIKGTYISAGLGHSFENIFELGSNMPIGMDIGASLGWGSASYNKGYWGSTVDSGRLNDLALSVAFPVEIAGWTIAPSLNYVTLMSNQVRKSDTFSKDNDYFFAGVSLSRSF